MSNHSKVLVPLESWCYHSPEVMLNGGFLDVGLLAEALVYYDQVIITIQNSAELAGLIILVPNTREIFGFT
jgi:hypothetical protein